VLTVESSSRADGLSAVGVRGSGAAVVVDVQQPGSEDLSCAVDDIRAVAGELTPIAASSCGQDATVPEGHEGSGEVEP
jgi:hypothetical protein